MSCLKFLASIDTIQNNKKLPIIAFSSFLKHQTSDIPMLKVRLQLTVLELQKYCCRTRVHNITIPLARATFCVVNLLRAEWPRARPSIPSRSKRLICSLYRHIGPWSNQTSCAVHVEGYFLLGKTYWGVRITACHTLLKTAMRLKMKQLRPHFPQYHNPFRLMLTSCTTRLIIHSRWALNSNYCPARRVSIFVAASNASRAVTVHRGFWHLRN